MEVNIEKEKRERQNEELAFLDVEEKEDVSVRFEGLSGQFYDIIYKGGNSLYGKVDDDEFQIDFTADIRDVIIVKIGEYSFILKSSNGIYIFEHGNGRVVIYIGEVDIN